MANPENATGSSKTNIDKEDPCPEESDVDSARNAEAKHGGFDCQFVNSPPEGSPVHCPICFLVFCDPYQVECCGQVFCQTCINKVHVKKWPCPTCNTADFSMFADKRLRLSLYAYRVRCTLEKKGCQWEGELGELEKHFNKNPAPDKQLAGCKFVEINCNHCSESLHRHSINAHQSEECSLRPFSCVYCRSYESSYDNVVDHWKVCDCHPVSCPNECGTCPDRRSLEQHVSEECPLALVDCDFCYAGCKSQLSRKDMASHLADSLVAHTSLMAAHHRRLSEEIAFKDVQLVQLKEEFERKSKVSTEQLKRLVAGHERSPQHRELYTYRHIALFFTVLVVVAAVGTAVLKQDIAQVNEYVRHLEQEILEMTQLVAEHKNSQGKQTAAVEKKQEEIILTLEEIKRAGRASLDECVAQSKKDRKHMENKVAELRKKLKLEWKILKEHSASLVPVQIEVEEFRRQQESDTPWYSQPFYSHVQGYKLCLRVDVNGFGDGKGTHVSVHIHLMRGEFDDYLAWPFRGIITLQLLSRNQELRDHHNGTIPFNNRTPNAIANRVITREMSQNGLGYQQFIKIDRALLFLNDDRLHFRVSEVQVKSRKQ